MKKTVSFDLRNESEWEFIQVLFNRLQIIYKAQEPIVADAKGQIIDDEFISTLYGSWPGDESSDETVNDIYGSRVNSSSEVQL